MEGSLWMDLQMTIHKLQKTIYYQLTCFSGRSVEIRLMPISYILIIYASVIHTYTLYIFSH